MYLLFFDGVGIMSYGCCPQQGVSGKKYLRRDDKISDVKAAVFDALEALNRKDPKLDNVHNANACAKRIPTTACQN